MATNKVIKSAGSTNITHVHFLKGGGEMGALIRTYDWTTTSLGPFEQWPQSLKSTIKTILGSRYPMILLWGDELIQFYNDAYTGLIGDKHPYALGRSIRETQVESWEVIGPMIHNVMTTREPNWVPAQMLPLNRSGYREESYFSLSYSAVENDNGQVNGMLCVCSEVTQQVVTERRLRLQRDLAAKASETQSADRACQGIVKTIAEYSWDVPFALLYLREKDSSKFALQGSAGIKAHSLCPAVIDIAGTEKSSEPWPLVEVAAGGTVLIENLEHRLQLTSGPFNDKVSSAFGIPITAIGQTDAIGILVAGISPNRALDEGYSSFYELLAGQISTTISSAQAHEKERKRAQALAELDRAKTAFFSNISHEFRTPLTLMLGPLEDALADTKNILPKEQHERLELIQRSSLRLQRLVNTLLDFSRIEAGRMQANYEPTRLCEYTQDLAGTFQSAMEKAGLTFIVDCKEIKQATYVDPDMWEKIVLNLLSNALKFTFQGHIEIKLREKKGAAVLTVSDTGIGIADDELPNLFKRFYRIQGARSRTHEGSGIGLALIQELVKLHGGTIHVASKQNSGTTFTVTIPTGFTHLPQDLVITKRTYKESRTATSSVLIDEAKQWVSDTPLQSSDELSDADPGYSPEDTPEARILVVDDNADMRMYLKRILSKNENWHIQIATDGKQAMQSVKKARPDLVLTDIMMPQMDGFELVRELRAGDMTKSIPIIFLSARAGEESKVEGLEKGADDYLVKPFSARELIARVRTHLEMARVRQNVTELKQAEEALRNSEERFRVVSDNATTGLFVMDSRQHCIFMNPAAEVITGFSLHEVLKANKPLHDIIHHTKPDGSHYPIADCPIDRALPQRSKIPGEDTFVRPDGTFYPVAFMASPIVENGVPTGTVIEVRDITEEKRAESELRELISITEQRNALMKLNKTKDEFIGLASHQLRTPATAVKQYIGIVLDDMAGPLTTEQGKYLQVAYDSNERELAIINDLLKTAQMDSNKFQLRKEVQDISKILHECIMDLQPAVSHRNQGIVFKPPATPFEASVDPTEIKLVFMNLLENASKYSHPGSDISVSIGLTDTHIAIKITDQGVGISRENQQRIFDKFTRINNELSDTVTGNGLGLYWVKQIVELHKGTIKLTSSPGKGSTFTVRIPG